jgi:hypothetical protein
LRAVLNRNGRLSEGMLVEASILARLLGMKVLKLDASVLVVPAEAEPVTSAARDGDQRLPTRRRGAEKGRRQGLEVAVRNLDEGAAILAEARRPVP